MREFICHVDANDRITFVDASWLAFAAQKLNEIATLSQSLNGDKAADRDRMVRHRWCGGITLIPQRPVKPMLDF